MKRNKQQFRTAVKNIFKTASLEDINTENEQVLKLMDEYMESEEDLDVDTMETIIEEESIKWNRMKKDISMIRSNYTRENPIVAELEDKWNQALEDTIEDLTK